MIKTKTLKSLVIALTLLFAMALTLGITGAAYSANRNADGTLSMANGIVIDYSGFGKAQDGIWEKEQTTTFKLFTDRAIVPGDTVTLNSAAIKKGTNSIDFYARIKFEYKFYDALDADITATVGNEYTNFISTPAFNSAWVNGNNNDGWFYYATGTTLNTLPTSYVNIFSSSAINVELNAIGFNHEGGGYKFTDAGSNEITIAKVEAILTLETIQTTGSTWEIIPLVQNSSSQVIEIQSNEITLGNVGGAYKLGTGEAGSLAYDTATLGTTLKIVVAGDSQINANAFANNTNLENIYIGDVDYISGASSYSAKIYTSTPTFTIGTNAFAGCTNLTIYLSSGVNYTIYIGALRDVANIYYDGIDVTYTIKNATAGTSYSTISFQAANIVTGGSVAVSQDSSKGDYTYTDAQGTWYFNLGNVYRDSDQYGGNYDFFSKTLSGTYAQIGRCDMSNTTDSNQTLTIPSSVICGELVGSIAVASVGTYWDWSNDTGLASNPALVSSIIIPSGVVILDGYVYLGTALNSVSLPNTITTINNAFYCASIGTLTIPSSVIYINDQAFYESGTIGSITSNSSSITVVDNKFLIDNTRGLLLTSLKNNISGAVIIPNGITMICDYAFTDCSALTSITIPDSVTSIGPIAFYGCTGLTSITIPDSVTSIRELAFYGCTGLTSITIPSSVTSIGWETFRNCTGLTSVVINGSITSILQDCFRGCSSLTSVTLPVSVTSIDSSAFNGCSNLQSINWSASYDLGAEKNNEVVTLAKATTGLTIGDINLPDAADLAAKSITAPTGQVFAGWTDGETTYTTTAPIATVRAGLTAVWGNE